MPDVVSSDGFSRGDSASQVSVRDLKTHLSAWLGRVQTGEAVEVTCYRKPIDRITGVKTQEQAPTSPQQTALKAGVISWNGHKPTLPPPVTLRGEGKRLSEIVIDDRG
jgi:antitoxin (DNA-binding transcriptional repressor) of toxin-antitoxin stability system